MSSLVNVFIGYFVLFTVLDTAEIIFLLSLVRSQTNHVGKPPKKRLSATHILRIYSNFLVLIPMCLLCYVKFIPADVRLFLLFAVPMTYTCVQIQKVEKNMRDF